jgi:hypothetical protein
MIDICRLRTSPLACFHVPAFLIAQAHLTCMRFVYPATLLVYLENTMPLATATVTGQVPSHTLIRGKSP